VANHLIATLVRHGELRWRMATGQALTSLPGNVQATEHN